MNRAGVSDGLRLTCSRGKRARRQARTSLGRSSAAGGDVRAPRTLSSAAAGSMGRSSPSRSGEDASHAANGLSDPLLVLDEREADVAFTVTTEAATRADGDVP